MSSFSRPRHIHLHIEPHQLIFIDAPGAHESFNEAGQRFQEIEELQTILEQCVHGEPFRPPSWLDPAFARDLTALLSAGPPRKVRREPEEDSWDNDDAGGPTYYYLYIER